MTSTPNSTLNSTILLQKMEEFVNNVESNNNPNEEDMGNILPDSFLVHGGRSPPENLSRGSRYSSQGRDMELPQPQKRFVLKPLPDDYDDLEAFYDFKIGHKKE